MHAYSTSRLIRVVFPAVVANARKSWHEVERGRGAADPFPGLDVRKVDMAAYNDPRETLDKRQLQYYRVLGAMPSVAEDPNLHAAAHLYASDRNGLFPVSLSIKSVKLGSWTD